MEALADWLAAADAEPEPLVVESSGSTGRPKRVLLSRHALTASAAMTAERLGGHGQWLLALPPGFVAGLQVLVRSLVAGHTPVILDDHPDLPSAVSAMTSAPRRFLSFVPTQLWRCLDSPADLAALGSLDAVLIGGGPVDPELRAEAEAAGVRVVATYGSAETAAGCVHDGVALPGVRLRIAGGGRVEIAGPMLFDGYVDDPAATAEAMSEGWYRTRDLGELSPDGRLRILGRLDDIVLSGGINIPGGAVAARLRCHPQVRAAEVVGVPDSDWGQRVVAFVVGEVSEADARDFVAEELPREWAPRQVVPLAELPLLPNGKTDRMRLIGMV